MAGTALPRRMSAEDAAFLYFEKPDAPLHIGSIAIYEGQIDFDRFYASMDARMHLIPRYRQRAVIPPFFTAHPTWEDDPEFSLTRHLSVVELPTPGNERQLMELACDHFAQMLPRDRPLWDILIIRGLECDRTAMVSRVHHCLVDGVSGIELLLAVLDLVPDPEPTPPPEQPWRPQPPPDPVTAWAEGVFETWSQAVRAWTDAQQRLLDARGNIRAATDFARSLQTAMQALRPAPRTPWNRPVGARRRAAFTQMSFQEVRGIRGALGGTVNDVMLTVLGGALGRYLHAHGVKTHGMALRLMIPVNVRREDEKGALGNRVSMMLPNVPVGIEDPAARLVAVREEMDRLKSRHQADAFESLQSLGRNMPALYHALAGMAGIPHGQINLVCTNVPGPMIPLYCVGHRMLAHYPLVPLAADLGIGVGITSFDKALFMGIMSDPAIVPDVDAIGRACDAEFIALREAAGVAPSDLPAMPHKRSGNGNGHAKAPVAPATPAVAPV